MDPDFLVPSDCPSITASMEHIQRLLKHFWKRWRDEYLVVLRDMHRFNITTGGRGCHIALGDIVLVHDEDCRCVMNRSKLQLLELHPNRDN